MVEQMVTTNGVRLCAESFGSDDDPAVLLIMGATASMIRWEDEFCRRLAHAGRYVLRFDTRDTGKSVSYPPGSPGYDLNDLVDDAAGVLDAFEVQNAHVVGLSLGGVIAQRLAIRYPTRVATTTLMMTNPDGVELPDVQVLTPELLALFEAVPEIDFSDAEAAAAFVFDQWSLCAGNSTRVYDVPRGRELAALDVKRAENVQTCLNHAAIDVEQREDEPLSKLKTPTLVIHGTEDPMLPYAYGLAFRDAIPGSELLTLDGAGHELHVDDWDTVIGAIGAHTSAHPSPPLDATSSM